MIGNKISLGSKVAMSLKVTLMFIKSVVVGLWFSDSIIAIVWLKAFVSVHDQKEGMGTLA
jgi:hypothetical protein